MNKKNKKIIERFLVFTMYFSAILTFIIFFMIVCLIVAKGISRIKPSFFSFIYTSQNMSVTPSIISTLIIVFFHYFYQCQ